MHFAYTDALSSGIKLQDQIYKIIYVFDRSMKTTFQKSITDLCSEFGFYLECSVSNSDVTVYFSSPYTSDDTLVNKFIMDSDREGLIKYLENKETGVSQPPIAKTKIKIEDASVPEEQNKIFRFIIEL